MDGVKGTGYSYIAEYIRNQAMNRDSGQSVLKPGDSVQGPESTAPDPRLTASKAAILDLSLFNGTQPAPQPPQQSAQTWPTYSRPQSVAAPVQQITAAQDAAASENSSQATQASGRADQGQADQSQSNSSEKGSDSSSISQENQLSAAEKQQVRELSRIDRQVRAHEAAHIAASGGLAQGGASFSYSTGPDGKRYAVGGEVSIDTSPVPDDPQATILKMQTVRRAALAPANPSSQDRSVAAQASRTEAQARMESAQLKNSENQPDPGSDNSPASKSPGKEIREQ